MSHHEVPRVSVVMAVHNGGRHLREAIDSILGQTFRDFEFIIVDDASTDGTPEVLKEYARRDLRIRLMRNEMKLGPYPSGNRGLEAARAPIIARMDADDISAPERLERQVAFLERNTHCILVGCGHRAIDEDGRTQYTKRNSMDDFALRWQSRFRMPMMHSSFCFRSTLPDGASIRYDEAFSVGQDYALIAKLLPHGRMGVLPGVLVQYRRHKKNISSQRNAEQTISTKNTSMKILADQTSDEMASRFVGLFNCLILKQPATEDSVTKSIFAFDKLLENDIAAHPHAKRWLRRQAAGILAEAFLRNGKGLRSPRVIVAFLLHGRRYLWPLLWRVLENTGYLPRRLESFPDPERG